MLTLVLGIAIGLSLGLIIVAFFAVGSYDRGWDAALRRRAVDRFTYARW
jgi:hypothetical protein